jgi:hypothetical protein
MSSGVLTSAVTAARPRLTGPAGARDNPDSGGSLQRETGIDTMKPPAWAWGVYAAVLLAPGCDGEDRALKRDMLLLGLAYHNVCADGAAPKGVADLQRDFKEGASALERIKKGELIVRWGFLVPGDFPDGTSLTVLIYEKDVPARGGAVLMADGSFRRMTAEQFKQSARPVTREEQEKEKRQRAAEVRALVVAILDGNSGPKQVKIGDRVLKVGDRAPVSGAQWVKVFPLHDQGNPRVGDDGSRVLQAGAAVTILGFTRDGTRALLEYTLPKGQGARGTMAPSGVGLFLPVEEVARMPERNAGVRAERARLKAQVEKITTGKSTVREVEFDGKNWKVGDTKPVTGWQWVTVMNLTPVEGDRSLYRFQDKGELDTCGVSEGGTLKVLGFTDDREQALVEYRAPAGSRAAGTMAPSGIQYFIPVRPHAELRTK